MKWVSLVVKMGAHIAMGLGDIVPSSNLEYKGVIFMFSEGVGKDPPRNGPLFILEELVTYHAFAIIIAVQFLDDWFVEFVKDKVIF